MEDKIKNNINKKTDLIYDEYKKYEVIWEGKEKFDDSYKRYGDSYSHRFRFENNYGAGIIKHWGSYGYEEDLFELAVLDFTEDEDGELTYNTCITDDVIGHLTNDEVLKLLKKIKTLKRGEENGNK